MPGGGGVDLGDAFPGECGGLGRKRGFLERGGLGFGRVLGQVEGAGVGVRGELAGLGEADPGVLGREAGHGDRALGHLLDGPVAVVGCRDAGLALADQNPEADLDALGAFGVLERARARLDGKRRAARGDGVGGLGPGPGGSGQQCVGEAGEVGHGGSFACFSRPSARPGGPQVRRIPKKIAARAGGDRRGRGARAI